jgi:PIN domain nuclease of toxin-antitoxin system
LTHDIAVLAYALPGSFHKDPADRILVATAIHHGLTLVTADERILAYAQVMTLAADQ